MEDEVVKVDESLSIEFEEKVKSDPDSIDVEDMTLGNIKKLIENYREERADLKSTVAKNLEKIERLEQEKEDCISKLVQKNQELDVANNKLSEMSKETTSFIDELKKVCRNLKVYLYSSNQVDFVIYRFHEFFEYFAKKILQIK